MQPRSVGTCYAKRTGYTWWVPARPFSTTSRPASKRMSPALSVSSRNSPDTRISPPEASPAMREAKMTLRLFADRSVPRARLVHAGSQQEHVWIIRKERHRPVDVSARRGLDDSREHMHHFRFGARIGLHVVRDDSRKGGTP